MTVDMHKMAVLRLLVPFLSQLVALRLMNCASLDEKSDEEHLAKMTATMALPEKPARLKWVEVGSRIWEIGQMYWDGEEKRRMVRRISWEIVPEPNIWSMDTLEI